jgi:hypothetical protein
MCIERFSSVSLQISLTSVPASVAPAPMSVNRDGMGCHPPLIDGGTDELSADC